MSEAYIVEAVRTPVGRRNGSLASVHSADLGAHSLKALIDKVSIDSSLVEDVIFGCVDTIGSQAGDIARTSWLAAGLAEEVPGTTIDRQCGSSQQALHFAAQAVMSGTNDIVVAGGVQNMSQIPISSAMLAGKEFGFEDPFTGSEGWRDRYGSAILSQFTSAQMIAEKWKINRLDMEEFALESHNRALSAIGAKKFKDEIIPFNDFKDDETPRNDTSLERMAGLEPLEQGGLITAATSSQISDASAAMLVVSRKALQEHNLRPLVKVKHISVRADNPVWMLTAPISATRYALEKSGISLESIGLVEINEAFASVVLAWHKELNYSLDRVNVNGGAIALGHPLGATGSRLMTTLIHEMKRTDVQYGLQTMCEGGGQANVTILENC
jgi:acetyl-CoA C-acetyltransferase|tara:strand:- start:2647 stop:3798 length:1152 start_codon:yes stop_codon:yes gene_type:complete